MGRGGLAKAGPTEQASWVVATLRGGWHGGMQEAIPGRKSLYQAAATLQPCQAPVPKNP